MIQLIYPIQKYKNIYHSHSLLYLLKLLKNRQTGEMMKLPKKKHNVLWFTVNEELYWSNISLILKTVFHHNADNHKLLGAQCYVLISPYFYTSIKSPNLLMNMLAISLKPTFLTGYHKCPYGGNNQYLTFLKEISCSYFFLEYLVLWLYFYFCNLRLMSILIFHMFHKQKTPCSNN